MTRKARILPSFLIIGAQRAGTTALFDELRRHPDIAVPRSVDSSVAWGKEIHFFDEKFDRGEDWYRSFFPLAAYRDAARAFGLKVRAGESTPYYLFHPAVPKRVATVIPDVLLIALLRDPVERAYSHYQLMRRSGRERLSLKDALDAEEERLAGERERLLVDPGFRARHHRNHSYVARGLYAEQLERWLAYFPREQLLILRAEDFHTRRREAYAEVLEFLAIRAREPSELAPRNVASYAPLDPAMRERLQRLFAEPNARLARLLGGDFGWADTTSAQAGVTGGC